MPLNMKSPRTPKQKIKYDYWRVSIIVLNNLALVMLLVALGLGGDLLVPVMAVSAILAWSAVVIAFVYRKKGKHPQRALVSVVFSTIEAAVITVLLAITILVP